MVAPLYQAIIIIIPEWQQWNLTSDTQGKGTALVKYQICKLIQIFRLLLVNINAAT